MTYDDIIALMLTDNESISINFEWVNKQVF